MVVRLGISWRGRHSTKVCRGVLASTGVSPRSRGGAGEIPFTQRFENPLRDARRQHVRRAAGPSGPGTEA